MDLSLLLRKLTLPTILLLSGCNDADRSNIGISDPALINIDRPDILSDINSFSLIDSWKGDLDGMEKRRIIRLLTVYGPGRFYLDGAVGRGTVSYTHLTLPTKRIV